MKSSPSEVEIQTIITRIEDHDMNLQPDFQRGEIWTMQKKKKLIDSVMRGWRIPPIHVVSATNSMIDEVLDGQQRLVAIRDFYNNEFPIDGKIEPFDQEISTLDGMRYKDLPLKWKRKFRKYVINIIRLTEYQPQEPAELFYRLNQPSALTSAEQRNAYMGITRDQVKRLSNLFIELCVGEEQDKIAGEENDKVKDKAKDKIGFSNSRMAYDEIISKFCYTVESHKLTKKVTSTDISEKYRNNVPFSEDSIQTTEQTLRKFMACIAPFSDFKFAFNKATLYSWLVFVRQHLSMGNNDLTNVISNFEYCRAIIKGKYRKIGGVYEATNLRLRKTLPYFEIMLNTFNQRSSMGSTDSLSIIYRDIIITLFCDAYLENKSELLALSIDIFRKQESMPDTLALIHKKYEWGEVF